MTSREQFEAWLRAQPHVLNVGIEPDGTYTLHEDRVAWEVWQASREALEVELPQRQSLCASGYGNGYFVACNDGEGLEYDDVVEAIRAAGIKVIEGGQKNG